MYYIHTRYIKELKLDISLFAIILNYQSLQRKYKYVGNIIII